MRSPVRASYLLDGPEAFTFAAKLLRSNWDSSRLHSPDFFPFCRAYEGAIETVHDTYGLPEVLKSAMYAFIANPAFYRMESDDPDALDPIELMRVMYTGNEVHTTYLKLLMLALDQCENDPRFRSRVQGFAWRSSRRGFAARCLAPSESGGVREQWGGRCYACEGKLEVRVVGCLASISSPILYLPDTNSV